MPDDNDNNNDKRDLQVPARDQQNPRPDTRSQAADYMRQEIDRIYDIENEEVTDPENPATSTNSAKQTTIASADTYQREHSDKAAYTSKAADNAAYWKHYHSAWQNYYQQYYERYYLKQLEARRAQTQPNQTGASVAETAIANQPVTASSNSRDQAVNELRSQLLDKVSTQASKVRHSHHFFPLVTAVAIALLVLILQYNSLIFAQVKSFVSPGSISSQNLIIAPTTDTKVSQEPKIVIPKISVHAPVVYGTESLKESYIQDKLKHGVVHYPIPGADSLPGQKGNSVFIGHSSNDVFNSGDYKFIFVQLGQLQKGDKFYLHYQGTRYTYAVTKKEIIEPDQINKLILPGDKPMATLITCSPPGTTWKRLIIFGEQISPDPAKAKAKPAADNNKDKPTMLPQNSDSLLEKLFGA